MDSKIRRAERDGEDPDRLRRLSGMGFKPKSREEFPPCPITGCNHESGSMSTSYCRNDECYVANCVARWCFGDFNHGKCSGEYMADGDWAGQCQCPCHYETSEDWLKVVKRTRPE